MMFRLCLVLILFTSCKSAIVDKNLSKKLFVYFKENLKRIDSTWSLDSLRVLKLDTVSENLLIDLKASRLFDEQSYNMDELLLLQKKVKRNIQLEKSYAALYPYGDSWKTLYDNCREDIKDGLQEIKEKFQKDSSFTLLIDSLKNQSKTADSTRLLYYEVKCLRQFHRLDLTVRRDTVYAFLSPDKDIKKRDEMHW